ncbi:hypothetical protein, partial [Rhizobium sp. NFR03]|uniref:hypothetical protein n=1 Tax=Rhizobium sp. NFR03 TaxID=1566263 RepID=UPI001AED0C1C
MSNDTGRAVRHADAISVMSNCLFIKIQPKQPDAVFSSAINALGMIAQIVLNRTVAIGIIGARYRDRRSQRQAHVTQGWYRLGEIP